jgi:hypothetical protein
VSIANELFKGFHFPAWISQVSLHINNQTKYSGNGSFMAEFQSMTIENQLCLIESSSLSNKDLKP